MKTVIAGILMLLGTSILHAAEYRVFTDTQGRAIEAKIVSYDPLSGEIELERKDGVRATVQPRLFSGEDQTYIKAWIDAYRVLSDESLQFAFDKQTVDSFKEGMTDDQRGSEGVEGEIICYEITLKNRSKKPIENLKIEYKYFIHVTGKSIPDDTLKDVTVETYTVDLIPPGERVTFKTEGIKIEDKFAKTEVRDPSTRRFQGYEYDKKSEDDLEGIWLKIYGPPVGDEPSVRDVSDPEDLQKDYSWEG